MIDQPYVYFMAEDNLLSRVFKAKYEHWDPNKLNFVDDLDITLNPCKKNRQCN
jgi:hypothetical protein